MTRTDIIRILAKPRPKYGFDNRFTINHYCPWVRPNCSALWEHSLGWIYLGFWHSKNRSNRNLLSPWVGEFAWSSRCWCVFESFCWSLPQHSHCETAMWPASAYNKVDTTVFSRRSCCLSRWKMAACCPDSWNVLNLFIADAPLLAYLPTFGWFVWQMRVNIPYMEHVDASWIFERLNWSIFFAGALIGTEVDLPSWFKIQPSSSQTFIRTRCFRYVWGPGRVLKKEVFGGIWCLTNCFAWEMLAQMLHGTGIFTYISPEFMDVSKNRGKTPQNGWFIMENPIKMGWFGGTIIFWKHPYGKGPR